jgi:hypothetical protein
MIKPVGTNACRGVFSVHICGKLPAHPRNSKFDSLSRRACRLTTPSGAASEARPLKPELEIHVTWAIHLTDHVIGHEDVVPAPRTMLRGHNQGRVRLAFQCLPGPHDCRCESVQHDVTMMAAHWESVAAGSMIPSIASSRTPISLPKGKSPNGLSMLRPFIKCAVTDPLHAP